MLHTLLEGVTVTVEVTVLAAALAAVLALVAGSTRAMMTGPLKWLAVLYIEIFRGTSALAQLFFIFFALPLMGLTLSPLAAGVVALGLNVGSYGAEVVRGAIQAIPRGQVEAARALSLPPLTTYRRVVLPAAVPVMLPSASNLAVDLLKQSSLVSLITLSDLTAQAQQWRSTTGETVQVFLVALVIYFAISTVIVELFRAVERRVAGAHGRVAVV